MYATLITRTHATDVTHLIILDLITVIVFGKECKLIISLHDSLPSFHIGPNILLGTLTSAWRGTWLNTDWALSYILNPRASISEKYEVPNAYKTRGKTIVLPQPNALPYTDLVIWRII
jgi:hypothetical protein